MILAPLRALLVNVLGRADEAWYWLYQGLLCLLDQNRQAANAMYAPCPDEHLATCGAAASPRIRGSR